MYFESNNKSDDFVKTILPRKIHLIKNLKANLLIENYLFKLKFINIFTFIHIAYIKSCDVTTFIVINAKFRLQHVFVHILRTTTISFEIECVMQIYNITLSKRDYLFELTISANFFVYVHLINSDTKFILIQNENNFFITIFRNFD